MEFIETTFFIIKYENVFSGETIHYMRIGFPSEISAQMELDRILKEQERLKKLGINYQKNKYNSAVFSGKNFRVEPLKSKLIQK